MTDLFDEKSKDWDANDMVVQLSSAVGSTILEHVSMNEQMTVMDFGAGTGLISAHVAPLVHKIVAVDTSDAMLGKLAAKPELQGKVEIACRNIMAAPLDQTFDLIISAMAMHHVEDMHQLMESFSQHLKPGGSIAVADLDKEDGSFHPPDTQGVYHFGFDRDELQAMLEQHGFVGCRFVTAHTIDKDGGKYPVFLVVATRGDKPLRG